MNRARNLGHPPTGMVDGTGARNGNGVLYGYVVPPGGYAPNGDIIAHSDSVTGDFGMIYDDLDRLIVAKAVSNVTAQSNYPGYFNCFAYDAYGNRLSEAMSTTGCQSNPPKDSWATYNANNNQMQSPNSMGMVQYDASGNMLQDGRNLNESSERRTLQRFGYPLQRQPRLSRTHEDRAAMPHRLELLFVLICISWDLQLFLQPPRPSHPVEQWHRRSNSGFSDNSREYEHQFRYRAFGHVDDHVR